MKLNDLSVLDEIRSKYGNVDVEIRVRSENGVTEHCEDYVSIRLFGINQRVAAVRSDEWFPREIAGVFLPSVDEKVVVIITVQKKAGGDES